MLLLFGMRPIATLLLAVTFVCGQCGHTAQQRVIRQQQKVTLFFVPLFSLGTSWFVECDHCGIATPLTRRQAEHAQQWAAAHGAALV